MENIKKSMTNIKIAIHHSKGSYSSDWIKYCEEHNIRFKVVNCYDSNIVEQLRDYDALMWHHNHANPKDVLFAKQLLFSLETAGKVVFPGFHSTWHFDDKLGQKYLLESMDLPLVQSYAFYDKDIALDWAKTIQLPIVFKLRGGAGSRNVKLLSSHRQINSVIRKAFGSGFRQYDPYWGIKESFRNFLKHKSSLKELLKAFIHIVHPIQLEKSKGREKGYVYFQEFIPDCRYDIRVQIVGDQCYAMYRYVRKNDFRASGSGQINFDGSAVPKLLIEKSFEFAKKLKMESVAFDFVPIENEFKIVEICYAWGIAEGELEPGYWDSDLKWHPGKINPFGWMIESVISKFNVQEKLK